MHLGERSGFVLAGCSVFLGAVGVPFVISGGGISTEYLFVNMLTYGQLFGYDLAMFSSTLSELDREMAMLSASIPATLGVGEVRSAVADYQRLKAKVEAGWLVLTGLIESSGLHRRDGARDAAAWLEAQAGESFRSARAAVDLSGLLADKPVMLAALASGELTQAQVGELARVGVVNEAEQSALVRSAVGRPVKQVARDVARWRESHGAPVVVVHRAVSVVTADNITTVRAELDAEQGAIVDTGLHKALAWAPFDGTWGEKQAHAFTSVFRYFIEHVQGDAARIGRPHVIVTADLEVIEGRAGRKARLTNGGAVDAADLARLMCDAEVTRIVRSGQSEIIDVGRKTRTTPEHLAKALVVEDQHCRWPGCSTPAAGCDSHHVTFWRHGGTTSLGNLVLLCWRHHQVLHTEPEMRLSIDSSRIVRVTNGGHVVGVTEPPGRVEHRERIGRMRCRADGLAEAARAREHGIAQASVRLEGVNAESSAGAVLSLFAS